MNTIIKDFIVGGYLDHKGIRGGGIAANGNCMMRGRNQGASLS